MANRIPLLNGSFIKSSKLRIGYFSQHQTDELRKDETPFDHLSRARPNKSISERKKILGSFGIGSDHSELQVLAMSGGHTDSLLLLLTTLDNPHLLILDEPTTGLDPQARQSIWQKLRELKKQGLTLILTTHYMEEAERLCDRVIVMDHGKMMADAPPKELIRQEIESHVLEVHAANNELLEQLNLDESVARSEASGDTHFFYGNKLQHALDLLEANNHDDYLFRPANLEDVFIKLTGRDLRE